MQIFQENIPTPIVASTTTLTLAATNLGQPTRINIGGQSYSPSALLTLNAATTGANALDTGTLGAIALYYVYAILNTSTFVPALVASLSPPSAGPLMPSGYGTAYKLVGAFYTNGSSQVGSIVTITGTATTGWMTTPLTFGASFGTMAVNTGEIRRNGDTAEVRGVFRIGTPTAGGATLSSPGGLSIDSTKLESSSAQSRVGSYNKLFAGGATNISTDIVSGHLWFNSGNAINFASQTNSGQYLTAPGNILSTNDWINLDFKIPIVGWNATLL